MVNTRAQASDPARDATNPDQDHAAEVLVNGATGGAPPPYFQQLVEQMQANNRLLQILCAQKESQPPAAPPVAIPPPATKRGGQRKKMPAKRPQKPGDVPAPASSRVPGQNRPAERSGSTSPRESQERRNPRYSRVENRNTVLEHASRTARSTGGSSRPAAEPSRDKIELRDYLNSKRSATRADPRVEQIWNRVFQNDEHTIDLDRSPFTVEILSRPVPSKFKLPTLDSYDGSSDPVDHLDHFRTHLSLQGLEDSAMCRCFPLTLKGDARIWFHHLPSGSIDSFRALTDLFLAQYASSRREEKQPWHLSHIKQKPGENPRHFLDRFVAEARRIPRITEEMKLGSFISALTFGDFFKHLAHKNPQSFREAESITRAYAAAEEANEAKRPERADQPRPFPGEGKRKFMGGEHSRQKQRKTGPPERKDYGPTTFTPLTDTRANVLMQIRGEKFLKWPKTLKKDSGNQSKYCDYHRSAGHSTEDCKTLQREIEELVRRGHLNRFIKGPGQTSGVAEGAEEPSPPRNRIAAGVVNMITTRPAKNPADYKEQQAGRKKQRTADDIISFSECDSNHVISPHADPLVISALVSDGGDDYQLKRVFIDNGSSRDLLYLDAFFKLGLKKNQLKPAEGPLYGLDNEPVPVQGTIQLEVTLGTYPRTASRTLTFLVVDLPSVYNAILGRPCLTAFGAVTSIPHLKIKFPTPYGVGEAMGDQVTGRTCYMAQIAPSGNTKSVGELDHRDEATLQQAQPGEATDLIPLDPGEPNKCVQIGGSLTGPLRDELIIFLRANADLFAWTPADMPGISAETMVHKLGLDLDRKPVRQKRRNHSVEKLIAIREEVKKLLDAGFIREVQYPDWLSNVVLVKKNNGKWRMCVDFTDVNKACPKDSFPLPRIDLLVDSTAGHELLSFMDAYSGYNQIRMSPEDEEHTSFMTDQGTYCYKVMPFGLKNAGATYQRLVNKMFENQIGRNMEVYVDDMLVKSRVTGDHIRDLKESFEVLRRHRMKLNPAKCVFGVASGKFLGFIVSQRGIEANPEKIKALADMAPPRSVKDVQRLTGRLAALSRFLAKSGDKYQPFFKALRGTKSNGFQWTVECQTAFEELKRYLASPPLLVSPVGGEVLYLYLATSETALSSVLVRQDLDAQRPVYYVSKMLTGPETRYSRAEKLALALISSARKLRPYFQAHRIVVLTDQPLKTILQKPDVSGRLVKWAIELGEFDIEFQPRPAIKAQTLADFLVETTIPALDEQPTEDEEQLVGIPEWVLHVDGSSMDAGSGAGVVLATPDGFEIKYSLKLDFPATNNVAEYEALLAGLRLARECSARKLAVYSDSELIVNQINGGFEANNPLLAKYLAKAREMIQGFERLNLVHIPRTENWKADQLAKAAAAENPEQYSRDMREILGAPSIEKQEAMQISDTENWMTPYLSYLADGSLPEDAEKAKRVKKTAGWYTAVGGRLYRRGYSTPYLRCLTPEEADYVLSEVHLGICGSHIGGKNLAFKVMRQGYFWPSMKKDALEFVKKCESCQLHGNLHHQPSADLKSLQAPWPFAQWGLDILGPFPVASGQRKFIIAGIDYFTKWVEAAPLAKITEHNALEFLRQSIVCRFGAQRSW